MSEAARQTNRSLARVHETDDLRTERIFELRGAIAAGRYKIDAGRIAERLADLL